MSLYFTLQIFYLFAREAHFKIFLFLDSCQFFVQKHKSKGPMNARAVKLLYVQSLFRD